MNQRTDTYDDEQWQLVPKTPTDEMYQAYINPGWNFDSMWERILSAAPTPPVAAPVEVTDAMLDAFLAEIQNYSGERYRNKLRRALIAALAQRGEKT